MFFLVLLVFISCGSPRTVFSIGDLEKHSKYYKITNVVGVTAEQFFSAFRRKYEEIPNISFKRRLSHLEAVKVVCNADSIC